MKAKNLKEIAEVHWEETEDHEFDVFIEEYEKCWPMETPEGVQRRIDRNRKLLRAFEENPDCKTVGDLFKKIPDLLRR
jgi:hypothetical protein